MIKQLLKLLIIFVSFNSHAKWINLEDSPTETQFYNSHTNVNQDGTAEEIIEFRDKILNEEGRSQSSFIKTYNANDSKIKIIEAYTLNNKSKYPIDLKTIEDKPLASAPQGFDQSRQILLSFPKAEIAAEIYLKYSRQIIATHLPNYYSNKIFFATDGCWNSSHRRITSKLPLFIEVNDPDNVLQVIQEQKNGLYNIDIKLKQPICRIGAEASETGIINSHKYTWVTISSIESWNDYAKQLAAKFDEVINQPIPELFLSIVENAKLEKNEIAQLNLITSSVNDKIRYMGYWTSVKGQFIPRDLSLTASTGEGDCKDFTAVTAAILKSLGKYKVQPVLVSREEGELSLAQKLPDSSFYNHVFLKITNQVGKIYWIDPTNQISMAQGIFPDIADKIILILDQQKPDYEKTPAIDPQHAELIFQKNLEIQGDKVINTGLFTLKGETAIWFAGAKLTNSEETIKNKIFSLLSGQYLDEKDKKELLLPDLSSRIVDDLTFKFKYEQNNQLTRTNLGLAMNIRASSVVNGMINSVPNQLADLYIGPNQSVKESIILKNIKLKNIESLNYENDTPWLYIKRSLKINGDDTEITDKIVIKKNFITNEELKTTEYQVFKTALEKNIKNVAVVLPTAE